MNTEMRGRLMPAPYKPRPTPRHVRPCHARDLAGPRSRTMDMRLELVPLPTADVDRSKAFYVDQVGFGLDHDVSPGNGMRIVQLTPPGSACSVVVGVGIGDPQAGPVKGLHLVVDDIEAA